MEKRAAEAKAELEAMRAKEAAQQAEEKAKKDKKKAEEERAWALAQGEQETCKAPKKVDDCKHHTAYFRKYSDGPHVEEVKKILLPVRDKLVALGDKENGPKIAKRKVFAAKVKQVAQCDSSVAEDDLADTLHTEGCEQPIGAPGAKPALFEEGKELGFYRFHDHSIGKAWCSYYLSKFPEQKIWKCNPTGGSWPGE